MRCLFDDSRRAIASALGPTHDQNQPDETFHRCAMDGDVPLHRGFRLHFNVTRDAVRVLERDAAGSILEL